MLETGVLLERGDALLQLRHLASECGKSRGQVALISGEAGVGKSSLVDALVSTLEDRAAVGWGRCDALFTPRQLGPFLDLIPLLGSSVEEALAGSSSPAALYPFIISTLDKLPDGSILIFEDLHWVDRASVDLLKFVARRIAPLRILILLTYRDDEVGPDHVLTSLLGDLLPSVTTRIGLNPLSRETVSALAQQHKLDGNRLYNTTGGNPFFISEVLAQPESERGSMPKSVRDAVLARVTRIGKDERRLLDSICVAPDPVGLRTIERLLGAAGLQACMACEAKGLLVRDDAQHIRFRHELARMALLDAMQTGEHLAHQKNLLDVYLSMGNEVPLNLIVHHAAVLKDAGTLLDYAPRAAARAAQLGACKEAANLLALALRHVDLAAPELAATLFEDWAHQTSLFEISDRVIAARQEAVARWRALNRPDRVGDNLRWLWRLHWYRGEMDQAESVAGESLAVLEAIPPSTELARAYALRSHLYLLRGQRADSIDWGHKAIDLAARFDDRVTRVQTMVSVATSMLFDGDSQGRELMEMALRLAQEDGLHEEIARVHTNYSEYAIVIRDWSLAERLVRDGLAFDIKHGLDSWTTYLQGRHAQLRMTQGRMSEAETLAQAALAENGQPVLMRVPALTTLGVLSSRTGADGAESQLEQVLQIALGMREQQRITPVRLAFMEHHYIRGELDAARSQIQEMLAFGTDVLRPWDAGALRLWADRLGMSIPEAVGRRPTEEQALELAGDHAAAAAALDRQAVPFEAALCRLAGARAGKPSLATAAIVGFEKLGCRPGVTAARQLTEGSAAGAAAPKRTGRYRAARLHPLSLTRKEVEVLAMMSEGASNAEIAQTMCRSQRTIEHHVSAILAKLNASNRLEAILRVLAEPWIVHS